jgi:transposase-like protein
MNVHDDVQLFSKSRPLEPMYPVIFFDALRVKIREDNVVCNKAVYPALGVRADGSREIHSGCGSRTPRGEVLTG